MRRKTVAVSNMMDPREWLAQHLADADADADLVRSMLQSFVETLMSAEASAVCNAGYAERSPERTNIRKGIGCCPDGYRVRDWDTRVGTIELAIPKLLRRGSEYASGR